ncbi:MAG: hypothetical protein ACREAU_00320 [Nitrosopumilaceae archaeon]
MAEIGNSLGIVASTVRIYMKYLNIDARTANLFFSWKAIHWLESLMKQQNTFIQHAENGGEYNIPDTRYHVDGYCQETNTIYEFHGDLFHGNPSIFESHEKCHPFNPNITAGELHEKTIERENKIKALGYALVVVWESEFMKSPFPR